jgi:pentatricopeptide repeat protein
LPSAAKLFDSCRNVDTILCAAQIGGYAQHGMRREACAVADQMGLFQLNDVCFLGLIAACGHEGDVEEGCVLFSLMSGSYAIRPRLQHYTCVVDMFGRAGRVEEGLCIVEEMSCKPTTEIWLALLGSCRLSGNLKLAENAAECIWMLDPENTSAFRLLITTCDNFAGT